MIPPSKVLIVRNDRLGDTVLALPVVSSLKSAFPGMSISFAAAPGIAPLIRCVDGIEEVYAFGDDDSVAGVEALKRGKFDCAVCLRATFSNAVTLKKAGIPIRIGTSRRWYGFMFTNRLNLSRRKSGSHEADLNLAMLQPLGVLITTRFPKIVLPEAATLTAAKLKSSTGVGTTDKLALLHPGSGESARNWPVRHFIELARLLSEAGFRVGVTGSALEESLCREVAGGSYVNFAGKTNLLELAALIRSSALLVAASTGPLHLATALGTPVVGMYPPITDCLPTRWGPYGKPESAIMPNLPICAKCSPGEYSNCRCMEALKPIDVFERAQIVMKTSGVGNQ